MQRFAGLNSREGWNLTLQLSFFCEHCKFSLRFIVISTILCYNTLAKQS